MIRLKALGSIPLKFGRTFLLTRQCVSCGHFLNVANSDGLTRITPSSNIHTSAMKLTETPIANIPVPEVIDPPFSELSLATGWTPVQLLEKMYEFVNVSVGCPWWATVTIATVAVRFLMMPAFIQTRMFMVRSRNNMPMQRKLMNKFEKAKYSGNNMAMAVAHNNLQAHYKKTNTSPMKALLMNLPMPLLFISMMMALRQMTGVPVPSMEAAQFLWMDSLTAGDPYKILPIVTGCVVGLTMYIQSKAGMIAAGNTQTSGLIKFVPILPVILIPTLLSHWPAIINIYVVTNSFITLGVTKLMTMDRVKEMLNFPTLEPQASKSTTFKETWSEFKTTTKEKATMRSHSHQVKREKKKKEKDYKKQLKGEPPVTYAIGTEAIERKHVPDFEKDWRPKRPNVYA